MSDVRIILLERAGCHLCAEAHEVLGQVAQASGERWVSVDVDASPQLQEAWGELVPVVLVDGAERGHWRLDATRVLAALRG
ncbi:glutaredoxin family protein [Miniimonas arenae]|uniref:Glutaredoxin family protein n=1 Tax=Miniimonas arenae TaxID=676201 RepID=A0A5C5BE10_9MICO|nr:MULTISPECIES: glutaredoxin family protein [Miniimonas]TNU76741.1 glutaredoxin family protein [Miniimonas arenae]